MTFFRDGFIKLLSYTQLLNNKSLKTKLPFRLFYISLALLLLSFTDPFLVKRISDADYRYEFSTTDKKIHPKKDKVYYWFKGGVVHFAQGGIAGEILNGKYTKTFHNNQLAEQGEFENGLKKGTWKIWHPNGIIQSTQYWKSGIKAGAYYQYDETGEIVLEGNFRNNRKHGKWIDFTKKDTVAYKKGIVFVKKPKLSKEEKKKAEEIKKALKKSEKENKAAAKEKKSGEKEIKKTSSEKPEKESFFKRLFGKKQSKQNVNGQGT